jgi:aryl-alcohol dehydrogenase-like predicted oxidoreductase
MTTTVEHSGTPRDRTAAITVLRAADLCGDHVDTSDDYGPHVTDEISREALHPHPEHLTLVTEIGARRTGSTWWTCGCPCSPRRSIAPVVPSWRAGPDRRHR